MKARFNVTYEIVTPESAGYADAEERGFIDKDLPLREAVQELFRTRTNACDGISAIERSNDSWMTVYNGMEFKTGAYESRSLHIPESVSQYSADRLMRLLGAQ